MTRTNTTSPTLLTTIHLSIRLENSPTGTAVGISALASDAQECGRHGHIFILSDDAGGLFRIDETSGEVMINGSLDYEAVGGASHGITVLATSTDRGSSSKSCDICD